MVAVPKQALLALVRHADYSTRDLLGAIEWAFLMGLDEEVGQILDKREAMLREAPVRPVRARGVTRKTTRMEHGLP